jgi:hypothetical protein
VIGEIGDFGSESAFLLGLANIWPVQPGRAGTGVFPHTSQAKLLDYLARERSNTFRGKSPCEDREEPYSHRGTFPGQNVSKTFLWRGAQRLPIFMQRLPIFMLMQSLPIFIIKLFVSPFFPLQD